MSGGCITVNRVIQKTLYAGWVAARGGEKEKYMPALDTFPGTGPIDWVGTLAEEEGTFVLLPILDEGENEHMAVFADGSYTRWTPSEVTL